MQAARPVDADAFRVAYMSVLADGAADELDVLRSEEPAMDDAALESLIDSLEFGAQTFQPTQRDLFVWSFAGGRSWWGRSRMGPSEPTASQNSRARAPPE